MTNLRRRRLSLVCLMGAAVLALGMAAPLRTQVAAAQEPGELTTMGVVAAARYDKLIGDINFIGALGGNPQAGQMVEGFVAFFTHGKGLAAIDKTQPWGIIVQTDGDDIIPVGCLPVTKPDDLLAVATAYGARVIEAEEGVQEVVLPNEQSIFVRHEDGWAFISTSPASLTRLPADPAAELSELASDYVLSARISVKDVPEQWRQLAMTWMELGMHSGLQQHSGETEDEFHARRKMAEAELERWTRMLNDTESVTFGWAIDADQQHTHFDFTQVFVPGSQMAAQIEAYGQPQTNFAGFYQADAAATMTFVTKADPEAIAEDIAYFESMMGTTRQQIERAIDENDDIVDSDEARVALKAAANNFIDAFEATIRSGQLDGGGALQLSADSMTLVAGMTVKDPAKVEAGLRNLDQAAQQENPQHPGVQWNAEQHAGVSFHTLAIPVPEDQEGPRQLLGSTLNVAVGIGGEAVYLAVGRDNLNAVRQAIDASAAEPDKAVPPFELAISLGPILEVAAAQADDGEQRAMVQSMADTIRNEAPGRDHLRMVGQLIPNGLRYRLEAEEGVLRAVGKGATEAQRAMQARQ